MDRVVALEEVDTEALDRAMRAAELPMFEECVLILVARKHHEDGARRTFGTHTSWFGFDVDDDACSRVTEFIRRSDPGFFCNTFVLRTCIPSREEVQDACRELPVGDLMLLGVTRAAPYNKRDFNGAILTDLLLFVSCAVSI
jgi:hypothetical protein